MQHLNANSVKLSRDQRGQVDKLLVVIGEGPNQSMESVDLEQLRLRVTALRNLAVRFEGMAVKQDAEAEIWAIGKCGARFTIAIPCFEALIEHGSARTAAKFMNTLSDSECRLGAWLTERMDELAKRAPTDAWPSWSPWSHGWN